MITDRFKDKRILIWGYGREGQSTERFLQTYCAPSEVEIYEGGREGIEEGKWDFIIKSPGIKAEALSAKYTSQTELFLDAFAAQTIGITGTKGKSTTSVLLRDALAAAQGRKVILVGNIGLPCLDYYGDIDKDTIVVFEMSCHQLAHAKTSPHVAVFLNLYEEHLDQYGTFDKYFAAKANIALHQKEGDFFICGDDVPEIPTAAKTVIIPREAPAEFDTQLLGEHNQFNARVVHYICAEIFGCADADIRAAIAAFRGLPHRLEPVGKVGGIDFYDDSISTIPAATIEALRAIPNAQTVLVGGMDRHIDYQLLEDFIREHGEYQYILMYETGARILKELGELPCCHYREDLAGAVALAKEITAEGRACLLSPAAASYGYFKNFEERGDVFAALARGEKS